MLATSLRCNCVKGEALEYAAHKMIVSGIDIDECMVYKDEYRDYQCAECAA
jgi:hypothetical protein